MRKRDHVSATIYNGIWVSIPHRENEIAIAVNMKYRAANFRCRIPVEYSCERPFEDRRIRSTKLPGETAKMWKTSSSKFGCDGCDTDLKQSNWY